MSSDTEAPIGIDIQSCSSVLLKYLEGMGPEFWREKNVLVLGAGSELGFGVSLLGANVICTEKASRQDELEESIKERQRITPREHGGSILVREEEWILNPIDVEFDIILNVDQTIAVNQELLATWQLLCSEKTTIYTIFNGPSNLDVLVNDSANTFKSQRIEDFDPCDLEDIHLQTFRLRKAPNDKISLSDEIAAPNDKISLSDEIGGLELDTDDVEEISPTDDKELSFFELLDQMIGISAEKLRFWIHVCLIVLIFVMAVLISQAYTKGDMAMVALHCGFVLIVLCLSASVNFVLYEAYRLEKQKQN